MAFSFSFAHLPGRPGRLGRSPARFEARLDQPSGCGVFV